MPFYFIDSSRVHAPRVKGRLAKVCRFAFLGQRTASGSQSSGTTVVAFAARVQSEGRAQRRTGNAIRQSNCSESAATCVAGTPNRFISCYADDSLFSPRCAVLRREDADDDSLSRLVDQCRRNGQAQLSTNSPDLSSVCSLSPAEVPWMTYGAKAALEYGQETLKNELWNFSAADWNELLQKGGTNFFSKVYFSCGTTLQKAGARVQGSREE